MAEPRDLFEAAEAREARDAGIALVSEAGEDWMSAAQSLLLTALPADWEGTGEDIRLWLVGVGLEPPHHHNAWGALINWCVRQGLIEWTGGIRSMRTARSHARATKVYRRAA